MPDPELTRSYDAVAFDLLTGLLDSWTLWNAVAGGAEPGLAWRTEYLRRTYGEGRYRPYELLLSESALAAGLSTSFAAELIRRWHDLEPWPEVAEVLGLLSPGLKLAVVTNCSEALARAAIAKTGVKFAVVVSAERAGWYKPRPRTYAMMISELGLPPERVLFVAGSPYDVDGAARAGMPVFWHNRIGLSLPVHAGGDDHDLVGTADSLRPLVALLGR